MTHFYPNQSDLSSTDRLERVFKHSYERLYGMEMAIAQQAHALQVGIKAVASTTTPRATSSALQANGAAPLNVQGLLGQLAQPQYASIPTVTTLPAPDDFLSQDTGVVRYQGKLWMFDATTAPGAWVKLGSVAYVQQDTYANRPTVTAADNGLLFYSTNQDVYWQVVGGVWTYAAGMMRGTLSPDQKPTLAAGDVGFLFCSTDFARVYRWSGGAWADAPGQPHRDYVQLFRVDPTTPGWHLCDGAAGVTISTAVGGTASITVPNLTGVLAYMKMGPVYSGPAVTAAVPPTSPAHSHAITTPTGAPSATTTVDNDEAASTVAVGSNTHTHAITTPTGDTAATINADGEPASMTLIPYLRL